MNSVVCIVCGSNTIRYEGYGILFWKVYRCANCGFLIKGSKLLSPDYCNLKRYLPVDDVGFTCQQDHSKEQSIFIFKPVVSGFYLIPLAMGFSFLALIVSKHQLFSALGYSINSVLVIGLVICSLWLTVRYLFGKTKVVINLDGVQIFDYLWDKEIKNRSIPSVNIRLIREVYYREYSTAQQIGVEILMDKNSCIIGTHLSEAERYALLYRLSKICNCLVLK